MTLPALFPTPPTRRALGPAALLLAAALGATVATAAALPASTPGAPSGAQASQATTLNYDVDLGLVYIDRLSRPTSSAIEAPSPVGAATADPASKDPSQGETPRALGLRAFRVALDWQTVRNASLHVVLRPDAVNRAAEAPAGSTAPVREFDARSDDSTYQPMPTIRLLDAYQLTINPAASLAGSLGVFEELAPARASYPELLGFGLGVRLPAKFAALRLRWERLDEVADTAVARGPTGLHADLYVMQGNEDRVEALGSKRRSFDTAPVAADPYYGGATQLAWVVTPDAEVGLVGGVYDAGVEGGKKSEAFGQLTGGFKTAALQRELRLSLDVRYASEKWHGEALDLKNRIQESAALTAAWRLSQQVWYLLGFSDGRSDRPLPQSFVDEGANSRDVRRLDGYQIETGLLRDLGSGVSFELMLSHEHRTSSALGRHAGGFVDDDGDHSVLRRMGLQLTYQLNDNA